VQQCKWLHLLHIHDRFSSCRPADDAPDVVTDIFTDRDPNTRFLSTHHCADGVANACTN